MAVIQDLILKVLNSLNSDNTINVRTANTVSPVVANGPTLLYHRLNSAAATTNATNVKGGAGRLVKVHMYNATATVKYFKLYDKSSAPVPGTDTPILNFAVKPNDYLNIDIAPFGFQFANGIGYAITGAPADNDATAVTAGDVTNLNIAYV